MLLRSDVHRAKIEKVRVWVVAIDLKDFGDEPTSGPSLDVDDDVERIGDIRLDRSVRQFNSTLEHTTRESRESLFCRACMNRAERTGVAGIQKLKQIERFAPSNFSELRGAFLCSWCELNDGYLSAVPHPKSKCEVLRFSYPREADIVGRVIGVTMRLVEAGP